MELSNRLYLKHGPWNSFREPSHVMSSYEDRYKEKFLKIKVLLSTDLIKYESKNFSIAGTDILLINIKKLLNYYCNRYY